jgi:hypothetical protein
MPIISADGKRLKNDNHQHEAHDELKKETVIADGECKVIEK